MVRKFLVKLFGIKTLEGHINKCVLTPKYIEVKQKLKEKK
jgi:hypothetical protein